MRIFEMYRDISTNKYWINVGIPLNKLTLDMYEIMQDRKTIDDVLEYYKDRYYFVSADDRNTLTDIVEFKRSDLITFKYMGTSGFLVSSLEKECLYNFLFVTLNLKRGDCFTYRDNEEYMFLTFTKDNDAMIDFCDDFSDFVNLAELYILCINLKTNELCKFEINFDALSDYDFFQYDGDSNLFILKHQMLNHIDKESIGSEELLDTLIQNISVYRINLLFLLNNPSIVFKDFILSYHYYKYAGTFWVLRFERMSDNLFCSVVSAKTMTKESLKALVMSYVEQENV